MSLLSRGWKSAAAVIALSVAGCNEQGYLYYQNPPAAKHSDVTHKLKQLQGNSVVDIVWVIDNSGSMGSHQQNVIRNTQTFMDQFTKNGNILDWKMGLVSTDKSDVPFIGFGASQLLTSKNPDATRLFQAAVNSLGTSGSYEEEGFEPLLKALRRNPDFVRPNSTLAVIFVTDAEEQGNASMNDVLSELSSHKASQNVVSYGIFWTRDLGCGSNPGESDWELPGSRYGEFVQATQGKAYPLCTNDFGASLADLGKDLVSRVTSPRLFLDSRPRLSTLKVLYQGQEIAPGLPGSGGFWYFDQNLNAIVFHDLSFAPGDDESVEVIYDEDNGID